MQTRAKLARSSRSPRDPVKGASSPAAQIANASPAQTLRGPPKSSRLARHLEGWQPALLCVLLAGSGAILAVPHPAEPSFLPTPMPDPRALARSREADHRLAQKAELEPLDADIRALGSALRAYGIADAASDQHAVVKSRKDVALTAAQALALDEESVLRLRAYQLRAFLRAVRTWEITGIEGPDLTELGGGFTGMLARNGWVSKGRVLLDDAALRAAWKRRWNEITGIDRPSFQPTLDEHRAFYRFVLVYPIGPSGAPAGASQGAESPYRLKKIDEIAALDPAYPADLARGIVLYRLGRYLPAVQAFRRHLEASPDGPFTLRARGYLRAALGRVAEVEQ